MSGAEVDCIFTVFAKYSMINLLSNLINRNCSAAKISKVKSSDTYSNTTFTVVGVLSLEKVLIFRDSNGAKN